MATHRGITMSGVYLSVCQCVCLSGSHTFLVVTHSYVLHVTHAISSECCYYFVCYIRIMYSVLLAYGQTVSLKGDNSYVLFQGTKRDKYKN